MLSDNTILRKQQQQQVANDPARLPIQHLLVRDLALLQRPITFAVASTFHIIFNAISGSKDTHQ